MEQRPAPVGVSAFQAGERDAGERSQWKFSQQLSGWIGPTPAAWDVWSLSALGSGVGFQRQESIRHVREPFCLLQEVGVNSAVMSKIKKRFCISNHLKYTTRPDDVKFTHDAATSPPHARKHAPTPPQ
ncbi:cytochrome b-c1 complex subunit 6, mitochondrial [Platysternon megacephalum]|uniref:Cytochrome b-c1 complex subunit 6, mitochondrial n=1 Tax=Platysternon megacephalum TaxID=55544 RepID=A0A4D9E0Y4_9SAUR|nr:cytochrome b-c1 complex subunit 6, mitochondrial [Platysternon megacephalum]